MLKFNNGNFRILQLTDMQDTHRTSQDTINLTREIIAVTKPDLIVLTGDQVKGYGAYFKYGDEQTNAAMTISNLMQPIAESGIPFTAVFGNHDAFGAADKDFQWQCYGLYENFIGKNYDFDALPIYDEEGSAKFCVYLFDTGEKKSGIYPPVKKELIEKYRDARDTFERETGAVLPALAFQHIPPTEIYECLEICKRIRKGALQGAGKFSQNYYALPTYAQTERSFMGENAAAPEEKSGQLEAFAEKGDVLGLYFGHDHNNSFTVKWDNLDLGYTQGLGFNIYGPGKRRGGRVFEIEENEPNRYKTYTVTAADLTDFKQERPIKNFLYTHSPSSVTQAKKMIKKIAVITAAAITVVRITKTVTLKKKNDDIYRTFSGQ